MFVVVEVGGIEIAEVFISQGGIQGATGADRRHIMPVSLTADALIRIGFWPRSSTTASYIQLTGNSDTLSANTVVKVYLAVVRGASNGGPGGGLSEAEVDARVAAGVIDQAETGDATAWGITKGGTGATTAAAALTALGVEQAGRYGGERLFGAVDPVATDGFDRDTWTNTADGTDWKKAGGAWTKVYTFPGGTVDPGDHTRYFGWKASGAIVTADFTDAETSTTDEGMLPARTMLQGNALVWVAEPEAQGEPTEIYLDGLDPNANQIGIFDRQAGTVNDDNGDPHIVMITTAAQSYLLGGTDISLVS